MLTGAESPCHSWAGRNICGPQVVEAASPALIEKVRSVVTEGTGQYRIVDLRPGVYSITFTLAGFSPVKREGIELTGAFTATVNVELRVGALEEQVTVTGESPIVDVQNVRQQRVVSKDLIDTLPSARTTLALTALVPGVVGGAFGPVDVGGTSSIALFSSTIHGGRSDDYRTQIEGFHLGSSYANFGAMSPNLGSTQEMTIDVGGASAEQATGGVIVNVIPKDGGNTFSGSLFVSGANESMQGSNFTQRVRNKGLATADAIKGNYDINPAFGGPIVRDRIWFYAGARAFGHENYSGGMFYNRNAGNPDAWTYVADPSRPAYNLGWQRGVNGRGTWQVNPKHKISVYYDHQARCQCLQTSGIFAPEAASEFYYPITYLGSITWSSPMTNRLLLQAGVAPRREDYSYAQRPARAAALRNAIPVFDASSFLLYRAPLNIFGGISDQNMFVDATQTMPQLRASLSYVAGAHEFKTGLANERINYDDEKSDNIYGYSYVFNNGVPIALTQRAVPFSSHQRSPLGLSLYAQDKWTRKKLTLNGGVRFEWYKTNYPDHYFGPGPLVPARNFTVPGADYYDVKDIAPRFGAAYDLFGNGRTALKASANKYVGSLTGADFFSGNPIQRLANQATRAWNDANHNFAPDCDLTSAADNGECGALSNARLGLSVPATTIDPETYRGWGAREYDWEFSTSVQHEVLPRLSVDVGYFRRIYGYFLVTQNRALTPSDYDPYSIVAPLDPRLPNGGGYVVSGLYDLNPGKTVGGIPVDNYLTFADRFGKQYEHWNGADVNVNARLQNGVRLAGGISTGRTSTDNCDVVTKINNPSPLYCHVDTRFLTQVKTYGSYTIPKVDVQIAGTFQSLPGLNGFPPGSLLAKYNASSAEVAQSLGRPLSAGAAQVTVNIVPPGTMYGERLNQLDLRFGKLFRFDRLRTAVHLDLYNALNADTVLSQSDAYAIWQQAQAILMARFAKLSVQLDF
jgi:hypothetical protein